MSEDTDVMFRIGVMDHPASKAALENLAKNVDDAQARMTAGIKSIGETASKVSSTIDDLISKLDEMENRQVASMRNAAPISVQPAGVDQRGAMPPSVLSQSQSYRSSVSMSVTPMRSVMPESVQPAVPVADGVASVTVQADEAVAAVATLQSRLDAFDPSNLSNSLRNVFSEFADVADASVDEIVESLDAFSERMNGTVDDVEAQTEMLRTAYQNQMIQHSETYAAMAKDLDGYMAQNGTAAEKIQANINIGDGALKRYRDAAGNTALESNKMFVESALHVAQMAKGLATIGLVSEESAEKFMQSLAVIQGTFDVVKGGVEAYEKFRRGVKLAGEATEFLNKAKKTEAALQTVEIARMKAYHASLLQEAAAANTAAAANGRLAASRTAAGAAATASSAGSTASGIVEGLGEMGGIGRMGRFGGMAGRIGSMALRATPIIAGAAALGTIGYQNATGASANDDNSAMGSTMKTYAWMLRLTGMFEKLDSPANKLIDSVSGFMGSITNMTGLFDSAQIPGMANGSLILDARGLAASQAGVERGQKSLDRNRILNDANRSISDATLEAEREKQRQRFSNSVDMGRNRYESQTSRFGFQDNAGDRNFERQQFMNRLKMRSVKDEGAQGAATMLELTDSAQRMRSRPSEAGAQLAAESQITATAVSSYAKAKAELDKTLSFAGSTEKQREDAIKNAAFYQDQMVRSLERQSQLARASGTERLQIEREIQSAAMQAIDQQQQKLDALNERRKSAMRSFVEMDAVERDIATKALTKARTGGAATLNKQETALLGRIGTAETEQFVDQSTEAQAKKLGFDASFGRSMDATRKQIEGTRQQLEAQLQASFDVSMKVEADTDAVTDAILPRVEQAMKDMVQAIERNIDQKLEEQKLEINTRRSLDLAALKRS